MQEDNALCGFAALFAKRLSALFGIEFTAMLRDWNALETELLDGRIHFTGEGIGAVIDREGAWLGTGTIAACVVKQASLYNDASLAALALE